MAKSDGVKNVPTYLDLPVYLALKQMASEDLRSMSNFITTLIVDEARERGIFVNGKFKLEEEEEELEMGR